MTVTYAYFNKYGDCLSIQSGTDSFEGGIEVPMGTQPNDIWYNHLTKEVHQRIPYEAPIPEVVDIYTGWFVPNVPDSTWLVNSVKIESGGYYSPDQVGKVHIELKGPQYASVIVKFCDLRALKWEEIKAERAARLAVAETSFGVFDSDSEAKTNISGIVTGIMATQAQGLTPSDVTFRMHDNTSKTFTPEEFIQASLEVSSYLESVYQHSWALKVHIDNLEDVEEVQSVTWESI